MARTRESEAETLEQRVKRLIEHSQGTMPICMVVDTEAEADRGLELLKKTRNPAAELISVQVKGTGREWTIKDKQKARPARAAPRKGRR